MECAGGKLERLYTKKTYDIIIETVNNDHVRGWVIRKNNRRTAAYDRDCHRWM